MEFAKFAIRYYVKVTGNDWHRFFELAKVAKAGVLAEQDDEMWLVHSLVDVIEDHGVSLDQLMSNKDAIKKEFDEDGRKNAGEFFTPLVWVHEAYKYIDKYVPDWREKYKIWDNSCGSGNLLKESKADMSHVYMSTLQDDDVAMVSAMPEFQGATVFQCDFLEGIDYDVTNTEFLDKLPEGLQNAIRNDEPLLFIVNPPYKSGMAGATDVGRYMKSISTKECDLSKSAYDLFYQFCWRVFNFVKMFNLSNTYYAMFGPLQFFTGSSTNVLLKEFEHCFQFLDGMCISAQEFSDTSDSILWGIGFTLWKSRGGYLDVPYEAVHNDILLEKKMLKADGTGTECGGRILYELPREKMSLWVEPKDVVFYNEAPLMTSHLTFKGGAANEKVAYKSGRLAENALGTLMTGNTLTRSSDQSAVLSMPTTIQYVDITEENFWRCVSSYTFRRVIDADWAIAKKDISRPNESVEGYEAWVRNGIVAFLFEYKSMMSSLRGVRFAGGEVDIRNKLFYLSAQDVRNACHDPRILADIDSHPQCNDFMLRMIEESKPYWSQQSKDLFDYVCAFTLESYDYRAKTEYACSLDAWDAGFQQLRGSGLWMQAIDDQFVKLLTAYRDFMRKDIFKFGFVTEVVDDE